MVTVELSRSPTNSPTCTSTSVTAKATPATVMKKRSLSCNRFFRARSTMAWLLQQSAQRRFQHQLRGHGGGTPLHPLVIGHDNMQRNHTVQRCPKCLAKQVDIGQLRAQSPAGHAILYARFQERVRVLVGIAFLVSI